MTFSVMQIGESGDFKKNGVFTLEEIIDEMVYGSRKVKLKVLQYRLFL